MRKTIVMASVLLLAGTLAAFTQDASAIIETYRRNFVRSSLGTKFELLKEAATYENVDMGPLYDTALLFILNNSSLLLSDATLRDMAVLSVNMIRKYQHTQSAEHLWSLFKVFVDNTIRIPVLQTLGDIATGNTAIIKELNGFLDTQMNLHKSGIAIDLALVDTTVVSLGRLGDHSSFPFIFAVYTANLSRTATERAAVAMASLQGDYATALAEVIRRNSPVEKAAALDAGLRGQALSPEKRAELAEVALTIGVPLMSTVAADQAAIMTMRAQAARELTAQRWQRASPIAIRHFYDFLLQFNRGQLARSNLLDAITLLGAMGTPEAAQALAQYLQIINSETEQGKIFDEQIALAVVNNLGLLGDKSAFDHLLYIGYLQYPDSVKRAARDALQKLRW
jgi:hypothetical protein